MLLEEAIYTRVKSLSPYLMVKPIDPDPEDVDKLIIEAAWQIRHSPRKVKK